MAAVARLGYAPDRDGLCAQGRIIILGVYLRLTTEKSAVRHRTLLRAALRAFS